MLESSSVANILVNMASTLFLSVSSESVSVPKRISCMVIVVKSGDWHRAFLCCAYSGQEKKKWFGSSSANPHLHLASSTT